jgi:hypothetical protein
MTATLERRYRRLLLAYPEAYRRRRGDELLSTLMELSHPDQRWPAPRQAKALLLAGVRARAGIDQLPSTAHAWRDSARAALVLVLTWQIITEIWLVELARADMRETGDSVSWRILGGSATTVVIAGAAILILLTGRYRPGIALALLIPVVSVVPPFSNTWDNNHVFQVLFWWLPVAALATPLLRRPAPSGPWRWLLTIPLLVLASALLPLLGLGITALCCALVMLAVCLAWAAMIDPRPALALGLLLLTAIPMVVATASVLVILVPALLILGAALLTTGALRAHHRVPA